MLLECRGLLEAMIDFGESDGFEDDFKEKLVEQICNLSHDIRNRLDAAKRGEIVSNGMKIAVIGPPNAGKSSLINFLADRAVSIVSNEPGTTRDVVDVHMDIAGFPVTISDTAGIRTNVDDSTNSSANTTIGPIELEGIKRAKQRASDADLILFVIPIDNFEFLHEFSCCRSREDQQTIVVLNKIDLLEASGIGNEESLGNLLSDEMKEVNSEISLSGNSAEESIGTSIHRRSLSNDLEQGLDRIQATLKNAGFSDSMTIQTSCKSRKGLEGLVQEIEQRISQLSGSLDNRSAALLNQRQRQHLIECLNLLTDFEKMINFDLAVAAEILRKASDALGKITGIVDTEEVLGKVFSRFCIGK